MGIMFIVNLDYKVGEVAYNWCKKNGVCHYLAAYGNARHFIIGWIEHLYTDFILTK